MARKPSTEARLAAIESRLDKLPTVNPYRDMTPETLLDMAEGWQQRDGANVPAVVADILANWHRVGETWQRNATTPREVAPQRDLSSEGMPTPPETQQTPPRPAQRPPGVIRVM